MKKINVAVIGAGFTGIQHIEAARRIPGVSVVALADSNELHGKKVSEKLGIPSFYADYHQMINEMDIDVVHVCTPNHQHYPICKDVICSGKHVYCEKPLANNSLETAELCALAEKYHVAAGVNFNYRQNAMVQEMRARVHSTDPDEEWGRTFLVHGRYAQDWMMYDTDYNWRCIPKIGGPSRTVADIGSHWFDTVQHILGQKITRVNAQFIRVMDQRKKFEQQGQTFGGQSGSSYTLVDIESEDAALINVQFENGIYGQVLLSQITGGAKNDLQIGIDGSRYSMSWKQEDADKLLIGHRELGSILKHASSDMLTGDAKLYATLPAGHAVAWHDALRNGISNFYAALRGSKNANYATLKDGDYIVRIVEACMKSNEIQDWVTIEEAK